jgi:hypothetical protein
MNASAACSNFSIAVLSATRSGSYEYGRALNFVSSARLIASENSRCLILYSIANAPMFSSVISTSLAAKLSRAPNWTAHRLAIPASIQAHLALSSATGVLGGHRLTDKYHLAEFQLWRFLQIVRKCFCV